MSFLTSICVSDIGSIPQNGLVNIFTNVDNYTTPIQTNVAISAMTGNNCPYYLSVPSGTTEIHIDYNNSVRICLEIFDPCTSCSLGFTNYLTGNTATISVGELTGSCATITDYVINWYGPDENIYDPANPDQNIVFTSGEGTLLPWQVPHPLNEPVLPGFYQPVISQVIINGTTYSLTGGTGTVQSNLNCLYPSIVVSAWTCDNGTLSDSLYSHEVSYSAMGGLLPPPTKRIRMDLKQTTKFLPIYFNSFTIPDTFKLTYYGTAYTQPIILEYTTQGNDIPVWLDASISTVPKLSRETLVKIISLTGLTRSTNDYVVFEIIPNNINYNTDFLLQTKCLETVDCSTCLNDFKNRSFKMFENSITGFTYTSSCGFLKKEINMSGCSGNDLINHDFFYYTTWWGNNPGTNSNTFTLFNVDFFKPIDNCYLNLPYIVHYNPCRLTPGYGTITTNKTTVNGEGLLTFNFTDYSDLERFYSSYVIASNYFATPPLSGTNVSYYKFFQIALSDASGNVNCGDNTARIQYSIHQSSIVVTGSSQNSWTMQMSMPVISNQLVFTGDCQPCVTGLNDIMLDQINGDSLSPDYTNISNVGACYESPVYSVYSLVLSNGQQQLQTLHGYVATRNFYVETLPYTGTSSYTFMSSLSSDTCNWASSIRLNNTSVPDNDARKNIYYYIIDLFNITSNIYDVSVYAQPISGHTLNSNNQILVYTYSAGTRQYIDTNYIIPAY